MIEQDGEDVLLRVKAVPGASRDEISGVIGDRLKVRVSAPPEGGKANKAICRVLAKALGVKASAVRVEAGASYSEKTLRVARLDCASTRVALGLPGA